MLAHPWLHFDGILLHLLNRENRGLDYWNLPSSNPVDPPFPIEHMPLKGTRDVFHASVSFFDKEFEKYGSPYIDGYLLPKHRYDSGNCHKK